MLGYDKLPNITDTQVLAFLYKRKGFLDAVSITGGEPTLHKELLEFIPQVKTLKFLIKLDTNGTNPAFLETVIEKQLVNYIAMDIKATPSKYPEVVGADVDIAKINKSIKIIMQSNIDYEFRTTVFPEFFGKEDAKEIAEWVRGAKSYVLQKPTIVKMLSKPKSKTDNIKLYTDSELSELSKILPNCTVR